MKRMEHISEEDLIAYQMREGADERSIREHLEECAECARVSESIAETLRVFSGGPVPEPDLERNWQRLRGNLSVLSAAPRRFGWLRIRWMWPAAGLVAAALLLVAFVGVRMDRSFVRRPTLAVKSHGPLTEQPTDPALANHLDAAERLLTEVNNSSGPLDEAAREQAHSLLLKNAVYVHQARTGGDVAEASVLENLGRVLTTIDNEPGDNRVPIHETSDSPTHDDETLSSHSTLGVRLEMNTSGLLLEIRILRQNDIPQ